MRGSLAAPVCQSHRGRAYVLADHAGIMRAVHEQALDPAQRDKQRDTERADDTRPSDAERPASERAGERAVSDQAETRETRDG